MSSPQVLCVDIGSTFTKAALIDPVTGQLLGRGETPTTIGTDVMDGVHTLAGQLGVTWGDPAVGALACSSAGGGLRLAVVGYERTVTAEAGYRVGLSAGAKVVAMSAGPLDAHALGGLVGQRPDIVLLVGGTDGGNSDVLRHNAAQLADADLPGQVPIVVAGNIEAQPEVCQLLAAAGRAQLPADNVLPEIGVVAPESARRAIREAFLRHVIGGKGLSSDPDFARVVRCATPDAVLAGVEVLADVLDQDVIVIDVGGATTDVYSSVTARGEEAGKRRDVVGTMRRLRTVEGDLGMRWSATGVLDAADREHLPVSDPLREYAARVAAVPGHLPEDPAETDHDLRLARYAAIVAMRRHGRPPFPGEQPRQLTDAGLVLGSGGVLRHCDPAQSGALLKAVCADHAGGWRVPRAPRIAVDTAYLLVVVGLLADAHPQAAQAVASRLAR